MATRQKRTPNQVEFEKQIARLKRITKQIETDYGVSFEGIEQIKKPKRITQKTIAELKAITPKKLREQVERLAKQPQVPEIKSRKSRAKQEKSRKPRNRYLEQVIRNARRSAGMQRTRTQQKRIQKPDTVKSTQQETPIREQDAVIDTVYQMLYEWVFNIADAHEGYEDVKKADRDLVWAIIGKAISQLGEQQVALNIRNNSGDIEGIINRIIYGSDETTVRFDIAELARIVNGRSLTIDESIYLTEVFETRTLIEFDDEEIESDSPYFATLKGYDTEK